MTDDIPQWAKERAYELANASRGTARGTDYQPYDINPPWRIAFARYIAEHEEPPVDPLVAALEDFGRIPGSASHCDMTTRAKVLREALEMHGLEIREVKS